MIDAHCHLEFNQFDGMRDEVIKKSKERLLAVIDSAAEETRAPTVLNLSEKHPNFIFPVLGLHPSYAVECSDEKLNNYLEYIRNRKDLIYGIGEVGLDYFHVTDDTSRELTKRVFKKFILLSNELKLPLVIHTRDAMDDTLDILEENDAEKVMLHTFTGNIPQSERVIDLGYYVSFSTMICRTKEYDKSIKRIPLYRILLETDSPFLAPKKGELNYPWNIKLVAQRIAELKGYDFDYVWKVCAQNAIDFFKLPIK